MAEFALGKAAMVQNDNWEQLFTLEQVKIILQMNQDLQLNLLLLKFIFFVIVSVIAIYKLYFIRKIDFFISDNLFLFQIVETFVGLRNYINELEKTRFLNAYGMGFLYNNIIGFRNNTKTNSNNYGYTKYNVDME